MNYFKSMNKNNDEEVKSTNMFSLPKKTKDDYKKKNTVIPIGDSEAGKASPSPVATKIGEAL